MSECKEIKVKNETEFPLKIQMELLIESDYGYEGILKSLESIKGEWIGIDEMIDIIKSK